MVSLVKTRRLKHDAATAGEKILRQVLEASDLRGGKDFIEQGSGMGLKSGSGKVSQPDFVIMLPKGRHIIIDAKVTINSYKRYIESENEKDKESHKKEYNKCILSHVKELSSKDYSKLEGLNTPDFVIMFLPSDGALSFAVENNPTLFNESWKKGVVLASPSSLFAMLSTVASVWNVDRQNRNTLEIARQGGDLYDKFVGFVDNMKEIGSKLNSAKEYYDKAFNQLSTGKGNLIKRTEDLKTLGIKAKKEIDRAYLEKSKVE